MAIIFIASSANTAGSGNLTVTPPATQTNDIMLLAVSTHDTLPITLPAGWTIIDQDNNGADLRSTTAWKRAVGAEAAFTITHFFGNCIVANVAVFRGCSTTSAVINAHLSTVNSSSSTCTAAAITPTVDNCMICFTMHDSDAGSSSSQAATSPASFTERFDNASAIGLHAAVSLASGLQTSATSTGAATGSLTVGPDVNNGTLIALAPQTTATKTQNGVARVQITTTKTQNGVARIEATVSPLQTQDGKARIRITTPQTQAGISRIQIITSQTQTGVARMATGNTTQTQPGVARIQVTTTRTQSGIARIRITTPQTQTGKARVRITTTKTQTGVAKLGQTRSHIQTGVANIIGGAIPVPPPFSWIPPIPAEDDLPWVRISSGR